MATFDVLRAPLSISVDRDGLTAACVTAKPGTVITQSVAGAPLVLDLSGTTNVEPGVVVVLPLTQIIKLIGDASTAGFRFIGGRFESDWNAGLVSSSYGAHLVGSTRVALEGSIFGQSASALFTNVSNDTEITNCHFVDARNDASKVTSVTRFKMAGSAFEPPIRGVKFCYFDDGTPPEEGVGSSACIASGGQWIDTSHNDVCQVIGFTYDLTFDDIDINFQGAGIVTFGTVDPEGPPEFRTRTLINNIRARTSDVGAISWTGTDTTITNSGVGIFEEDPGDSEVRIGLFRFDGSSRVQAGGNYLLSAGAGFTAPVGISMTGALNGDAGVVLPEAPRMLRAAWFPAIPARPAAPPLAEPPISIGGPSIEFFGATAVEGTYLSCNRRSIKNGAGATWEYRWTRNGTPISGATAQVYQVAAADVGQLVRVEIRGTNVIGPGVYAASDPVTITA